MTDTPTDPAGDAPLDYIDEIAVLAQMIDDGQQLVEEGNSIDLSQFETSVSALCTRLAADPPDNIEEVSRAIEGLVGKLAALSAALQTQAGSSN